MSVICDLFTVRWVAFLLWSLYCQVRFLSSVIWVAFLWSLYCQVSCLSSVIFTVRWVAFLLWSLYCQVRFLSSVISVLSGEVSVSVISLLSGELPFFCDLCTIRWGVCLCDLCTFRWGVCLCDLCTIRWGVCLCDLCTVKLGFCLLWSLYCQVRWLSSVIFPLSGEVSVLYDIFTLKLDVFVCDLLLLCQVTVALYCQPRFTLKIQLDF